MTQEPPTTWMGSKPEYMVFIALLRLGMAGKFTYQSSQLGGRLAKGGVVLDFYFPDMNLAINVQSAYYHYSTSTLQARGQMQRAQLESMGIRMIYIDEDDILRDVDFYVKEALNFIDHSRMAG